MHNECVGIGRVRRVTHRNFAVCAWEKRENIFAHHLRPPLLKIIFLLYRKWFLTNITTSTQGHYPQCMLCWVYAISNDTNNYLHIFSLCCICGTAIPSNPSNMCVTCVRNQVDITEGIAKQLTIHYCKLCGRWVGKTSAFRSFLMLRISGISIRQPPGRRPNWNLKNCLHFA